MKTCGLMLSSALPVCFRIFELFLGVMLDPSIFFNVDLRVISRFSEFNRPNTRVEKSSEISRLSANSLSPPGDRDTQSIC